MKQDRIQQVFSPSRQRVSLVAVSILLQAAILVVALGMFVGFTGVVTFKNARRALEAAAVVPLDRLLVETDCPYMAPEPFRGKRCDSSLLPCTIAKLAEIKGISPQALTDAAAENARRLFGCPRSFC